MGTECRRDLRFIPVQYQDSEEFVTKSLKIPYISFILWYILLALSLGPTCFQGKGRESPHCIDGNTVEIWVEHQQHFYKLIN